MFGEKLNLEKDEEILKINSPKEHCEGPYKVVFKDMNDRWAIVALTWDGNPTLGIRWFWGEKGNPTSTGYPTWLIIPSTLHNAVLNGLPLDFSFRDKLNYFLANKIDGNKLKEGE